MKDPSVAVVSNVKGMAHSYSDERVKFLICETSQLLLKITKIAYFVLNFPYP